MKTKIPEHFLQRWLLSVAFIAMSLTAFFCRSMSDASMKMVSATFILLMHKSGPAKFTLQCAVLGVLCAAFVLLWNYPVVCADFFAVVMVIYSVACCFSGGADPALLCNGTPLDVLRFSSHFVHLCVCLSLLCLLTSFSEIVLVCVILTVFIVLEDIILLYRIWTGRCGILIRNFEAEVRRSSDVTLSGRARLATDSNMMILYSRIQKMMDVKKPYLEESFNLTEMSRMMCTNTTYISRTINTCFGQNFSRFVNAYRIRYAISLINADRRLKYVEVASMSGFHTQVSFDMAFHIYTGKTPTEYFREHDGFEGNKP